MNQNGDHADTPPRPGGAVDGRIAGSVTCKQCSYDLKGLWSTGRCPECGASVESTLQTIHPDGIQTEALEEFARGLRTSGSTWLAGLLVFFLCPCGSLASGFTGTFWPFFGPLVFLFVLTSVARTLTLPALNRGSSFMPDGFPMPIWLLAGSSSLTMVIGLTLTMMSRGIETWFPLIFAASIACEGLLWTRFVARCAVVLECPHASHLGRFGVAFWVSMLAVIPLALVLEHVPSAATGADWKLLVMVIAWIACLAGATFTGLFARGLGDLLPQLVELEAAPVLEELLEPEPAITMPPAPQVVIDDAPIELADTPGIVIEPDEREPLAPPAPPGEDEDPGHEPDVY